LASDRIRFRAGSPKARWKRPDQQRWEVIDGQLLDKG
jgi:hypothetical protein